MTLWETQEMEENARLNQWEEMNDTEEIETQYQNTTVDMQMAIDDLERAVEWLETSADGVTGFPAENKILSYVNDLNDLLGGLRILKENLQHGWED